jgi:hypothetical protein
MRVNIFDNGLQSRTGHHFDTCLSLAGGFRARGWEVLVCGTMQADPVIATTLAQAGCSLVPMFSHFAYTPLEPGADIFSGIEQGAQRMAAEFGRAPAADLNLFPSLKPLEFLGAALSRLDGANIGYVHAEPFHQGAYSGWTWKRAASHLRQRAMPFAIGAIDPVVADFLAGYLDGLPVDVFPIILGGRSKPQHAEKAGTFGFFGSQRVVLHDTNGQFFNTNDNPRLHILEGFVDDLQAAMHQCDLIICPMQREQYVHRMSGIACNAMAAGLPFVLPAGTLAAARFMPQGSCRAYLEHSTAGILHAVEELAQNYSHHVEAAKHAAQRWHTRHGVERFIDKVLEKLPAS